MNKIKQVKASGNIIGFNIDASGNETYNVQFPDMTIAELESYQFEEADAYHTDGKPFCLRNVLARLRELPEHDRKVWLKGIMGEFERDFSHAKWLEGYKQGKFDGMFGCEKVQIPQYEVSIKASGQYLARTKLKEIAFMYKGACSRFTRKELEEDGFGWVFDCDGVKVQEVK